MAILIDVACGVYDYYPIISHRQVGLCEGRIVLKLSKLWSNCMYTDLQFTFLFSDSELPPVRYFQYQN